MNGDIPTDLLILSKSFLKFTN
ncbi:hypothetical protein KM1_229110 [Entamoeba histolytica HM-3:IMSS]|uniref:Uncharacterized protein n=1 Tax=Entamoeba histolytica HM-3:IMSS TaxID=885315 RepID=M7WF52_ENTHI|nr:hypothetical protein KM1_229110 [Entamoeba histolytica HM-3:IMSS]